MDFKLELVLIPVSDVDRAKAFYTEKAGFNLDVDHRAGDSFRVVQMTPPGSACSITIGTGLGDAAPGSVQGCTWSSPTSWRHVPSWSSAGWPSARSATLRRVRGWTARTRSGATTTRSPTSATPTATPGSSRSAGTSEPRDRRGRVRFRGAHRAPPARAARPLLPDARLVRRGGGRRRRRSSAPGAAATASTAARCSVPGSTGSRPTSALTRSERPRAA